MAKPLFIAIVFLVSFVGTSLVFHGKEAALFGAPVDGSPAAIFLPTKAKELRILFNESDFQNIKAESFIIGTVSGQVLASRAADAPHPMASLTKIMTGLLLEERGRGTTIWVTPDAKGVDPKHSSLKTGATLDADTARVLLLAESDNDIAESIAGSVGILFDPSLDNPRAAFVAAMNQKAAELGMLKTHFLNPTGLDEAGHVSSARDLFRLVGYATTNYADFWAHTAEPKTRLAISGATIEIQSSNLLSGQPGLIGGKTGFTDKSEGALVLLYETQYSPEDIVIVLLRSPDRFADGEKLLGIIELKLKSEISQ
ncbi:MAG: D-alanyl-D-alanine carboxypeptidase [Candidatus Sungbacteria bacterium]|uniref:D-alanyl-D-alanine carboxypeptidase n=1 Tax=Candidatus Sungiibacteriota bacterium TaxID=2750080 RepID=A0A9D6LMQ8_9BACT|nr:D-alanyl-D-alanine carboxypeptidase [Candidatus Sungbacteria bacterium]